MIVWLVVSLTFVSLSLMTLHLLSNHIVWTNRTGCKGNGGPWFIGTELLTSKGVWFLSGKSRRPGIPGWNLAPTDTTCLTQHAFQVFPRVRPIIYSTIKPVKQAILFPCRIFGGLIRSTERGWWAVPLCSAADVKELVWLGGYTDSRRPVGQTAS